MHALDFLVRYIRFRYLSFHVRNCTPALPALQAKKYGAAGSMPGAVSMEEGLSVVLRLSSYVGIRVLSTPGTLGAGAGAWKTGCGATIGATGACACPWVFWMPIWP